MWKSFSSIKVLLKLWVTFISSGFRQVTLQCENLSDFLEKNLTITHPLPYLQILFSVACKRRPSQTGVTLSRFPPSGDRGWGYFRYSKEMSWHTSAKGLFLVQTQFQRPQKKRPVWLQAQLTTFQVPQCCNRLCRSRIFGSKPLMNFF